MIIDYTPEELSKLEEIREDYTKRMTAITNAIETAEGEDVKRLKNERVQLRLQLSEDMEAYSLKCQQERFNKFAKDPDAVLENAKEQIPRIINFIYKELTDTGNSAEDLKKIGITDTDGNKSLLRANFTTALIMEELKLHLAALRDNKALLDNLYSTIIEEIEFSDYTNGEEITLSENVKRAQEGIMRFRRSPLTDITPLKIKLQKAVKNYRPSSKLFLILL